MADITPVMTVLRRNPSMAISNIKIGVAANSTNPGLILRLYHRAWSVSTFN